MFRDSVVLAVNDPEASYNYGRRVRFEMEQRRLETYEKAADYVNGSGIALSNLQHEFVQLLRKARPELELLFLFER